MGARRTQHRQNTAMSPALLLGDKVRGGGEGAREPKHTELQPGAWVRPREGTSRWRQSPRIWARPVPMAVLQRLPSPFPIHLFFQAIHCDY